MTNKPLDEIIADEIARIRNKIEDQNDSNSLAGNRLTIRETRRLFREFVYYWRKIGEAQCGFEAATSYLRGGMYFHASRALKETSSQQAIKLLAELKGHGVYIENKPYPSIEQILEHYVRTQLSCSLLSGVIGCDRPIYGYTLRKKGLFLLNAVTIEGSCGIEGHEFIGEFTKGVEFVQYWSEKSYQKVRSYFYNPISVPGERPA